jgi:hypothetical protein
VFIAFCVFGNMIVEFLMFDYICEIDATWTRSEAIVSLWVYIILLLVSFLFGNFMDDLRCINFL